MKKSYLMIAAAALLVSCYHNDKLIENSAPQLIGFSKVYIEKGTKAFQTGAYDMNNFEKEGNTFAVFGYKKASNVESQVFGERSGEQQGVVVTFGGTDWSYTPLRYWDKAASNYYFYAYAPSSDIFTGTVALASNSSDSFSITGFKQSISQPAMIDLMTDLTSCANITSSTDKKIGENDVEFTFKHILSNINVLMAVSADLKADSTNNPVTVDSVEIGSIKMDGSYEFNSGYKWTLADNPNTQTFKAELNSNNVVFDSNELKAHAAAITGGGSLPAGSVGLDSVPQLTDLLFVPQTLTADEYVIKVKYHIANEEFHKTISLSSFTKKVEGVDTTLDTWEPGYKYNYVLIIGPTPIYFDVAGITGWADGGTYTYTID